MRTLLCTATIFILAQPLARAQSPVELPAPSGGTPVAPASAGKPDHPAPPERPDRPAGRAFATRGVIEIGGSLGLSFDYLTESEDKLLSLDLSFYMGGFVTNHFVLGAYLALPYTQYWGGSDALADYWRIAPGVVLAPGFAVGLGGTRLFVFGDLLAGIHGVKQGEDYSGWQVSVGAEIGLKWVLGTNYLIRLGLRPVYYLGKVQVSGSSYEGDISQFNLMLRLGFSGFI